MFFYMRFLVVSLVAFIPFGAYAGTATQIDWSGGDGVFGQVTDWGNEFYADTEIECYPSPSNLVLHKAMSLIPLEHTVDGDFDGAVSIVFTDINGDGYMDVICAACLAGDITWWDLTEYLPDGSLESSVLDVQESPVWQTLSRDCTELTGTSVSFQVRASSNSSSMGAWSDTLSSPCALDGILADENNYLQYRVILNTTDSLSTPALHDIAVEWELFTATEEGSAGEVTSYALHGAHPNPVLSDAVLVFSLPLDSRAELWVYDLTGRAVHRSSGDFTSGTHEVLVNDLACGVYLVRMTSGEFTATQQFVVIE